MNAYAKRIGLMVGVSTLALGMFAFGPANAFDDVDWTWTATVTETVTKDVDIDIDLTPTGLIMLEDLQIQIGDVIATSTVHGIYNNQPENGGGGGGEDTVTVDLGTLEFTGTRDTSTGAITGTANAPDIPGEQYLNGTANNGSPFGVTMNFDLGTLEVPIPDDPGTGGPIDALTQLPEVISEATAVGNNTTIDTDGAVELHEAQILVGDVEFPTYGPDYDGGVSILGFSIDPATVSATSTVYDILNASVDSSATAVGNNLAIAIEAEGPDRLLMADITQISVANVTATSTVYDVSLNNYINLGELDRPIVSSVATAVGNNKSISVSVPDVDGGDDGGGE
jgi:hypothetical protein